MGPSILLDLRKKTQDDGVHRIRLKVLWNRWCREGRIPWEGVGGDEEFGRIGAEAVCEQLVVWPIIAVFEWLELLATYVADCN